MVGLIPDFSVQMTRYSHVIEEAKLPFSFYDYGVAFLTCILYLFKPLCGVCSLTVPIFHPQPQSRWDKWVSTCSVPLQTGKPRARSEQKPQRKPHPTFIDIQTRHGHLDFCLLRQFPVPLFAERQ